MSIQAANLNREDIEEIAEKFAEKTNFIPCETNIFDYIKNTLKGKIEYRDTNLDTAGGSIIVNDKQDFTIYLSCVTPESRDVFTIAHELGHYVLHSRFGKEKIQANRERTIDAAEREANSFAASFLMPKQLVEEKFPEDRNITALANEFKVSVSAMMWRCRNLNLL